LWDAAAIVIVTLRPSGTEVYVSTRGTGGRVNGASAPDASASGPRCPRLTRGGQAGPLRRPRCVPGLAAYVSRSTSGVSRGGDTTVRHVQDWTHNEQRYEHLHVM